MVVVAVVAAAAAAGGVVVVVVSSSSSSSLSSSLSSSTSSSSSSCSSCCWQHVRLLPRGVVRFLCWHVLKLEFWQFTHPELNLRFVLASVFAVFSGKRMRQPAGYTIQKMLISPFRIVFFGVFLCVCRISHRFLRCFCRLSTFCTCQLTLAFVFQLCAGGGGGWGVGWGGDDVHANALLLFLLLRYFSNAAGCSVKPLWPLLVALLLKRQPCKNLEFLKLSKQKLRNEPPKSSAITDEKTWYLPQFRKKTSPKNETKNHGKTKPKHRLVDENHIKLRVFKLLTKKTSHKLTTHPARRQTHVPPSCCCSSSSGMRRRTRRRRRK